MVFPRELREQESWHSIPSAGILLLKTMTSIREKPDALMKEAGEGHLVVHVPQDYVSGAFVPEPELLLHCQKSERMTIWVCSFFPSTQSSQGMKQWNKALAHKIKPWAQIFKEVSLSQQCNS